MAFCPTRFFTIQPELPSIEDDHASVGSAEGEEDKGIDLFACFRPTTPLSLSSPSIDKHFNGSCKKPDPPTSALNDEFLQSSAATNVASTSPNNFVVAQQDRRVYTYTLPPNLPPARSLDLFIPPTADSNNAFQQTTNGTWFLGTSNSNDATNSNGQLEIRNKWSEPPAETFQVRGPSYLQDGWKISSPSPALFPARGVDLFQTPSVPLNIGQCPELLQGKLRREPTFICNFRFPWGILVCYFAIPERFLPYVRYYGKIQANVANIENSEERRHLIASMKEMTPGERALARFLMADQDRKNRTFKLIPVVVDGMW